MYKYTSELRANELGTSYVPKSPMPKCSSAQLPVHLLAKTACLQLEDTVFSCIQTIALLSPYDLF
jgi:hypothetical protein